MNATSDKVAFLFAGQGDQSVGMGADLCAACPFCRGHYLAADAAVDLPLLDLMFAGPAEALDRTEVAQPATVVHAVAQAEHLAHDGILPDLVLGYSVGHLAALVVAGAIDLTDAVRLAVVRGRAMQAAVPDGAGAMAAVVGLDAATVEAACAAASAAGVASVACYNAPGRLVIAGSAPAIAEAVAACEDAGGAAVPLAISVPSHCALMAPAAGPLTAALDGLAIRAPRVTVLNCATAEPLRSADEIRHSIVHQLTAPMHVEGCLRRLGEAGVGTFVQCGPGTALLAFARRVVRGATYVHATDAAERLGLVPEGAERLPQALTA